MCDQSLEDVLEAYQVLLSVGAKDDYIVQVNEACVV